MYGRHCNREQSDCAQAYLSLGEAPAGIKRPLGPLGCWTNSNKIKMTTRMGKRRTTPRGTETAELPRNFSGLRKNANRAEKELVLLFFWRALYDDDDVLLSACRLGKESSSFFDGIREALRKRSMNGEGDTGGCLPEKRGLIREDDDS